MRLTYFVFITLVVIINDVYSAEAGMPQLNPKYWASQAFWLLIIFSLLYLSISKLFIPMIKNNLDDRERKIKDCLDDAKQFNDLSEKKNEEYNGIIDNATKEVQSIIFKSKNKLNKDIQSKKETFEKEIEVEVEKAQKEILNLKKNSILSVNNISEELASKIIEEVSGDKLNSSSVKATISEISKKKLDKYL